MRILKYIEFINEAKKTSYPGISPSSGILTSISGGISDFFNKAEERFKNLPAAYNEFRLKGPKNPWGTDVMSTGIGELVGLAGQAVSGTAAKVFKPSDKAQGGDLKRTMGILDLSDEERQTSYRSNFSDKEMKNAIDGISINQRQRVLDMFDEYPPTLDELNTETGKIDYVMRTVFEPMGVKPKTNPKVDAYANMAGNLYSARRAGTI
jgi:hypothetical protein